MQLAAGLAGRVKLTVGDADTAQALGSGDVPVLATPRVVALVEAAAVAATAAQLELGSTTVGTRIELDHLAATPVGRQVTGEAEVTKVDGRQIEFTVRATEGGKAIGAGSHSRVVIDVAKFARRLGS